MRRGGILGAGRGGMIDGGGRGLWSAEGMRYLGREV